jgi:DNA-binding MarR family transcriptional regulator
MRTNIESMVEAEFTLEEIDQLRQVLVKLHRRLRKHAGEGLTPSQASALATLARHGAMRIGDLARREQISKSSATRVVARLERLGLLRRREDPDDQRAATVDLTEAGRMVVSTAEQKAGDSLAAQVLVLDARDQRRLLEALPVLNELATTKW